MGKSFPRHVFGLILVLGAVAASGILFFSLGKSGEAALDSKFIEKVGEGFIAPACGSSSAMSTCAGNAPSVSFSWSDGGNPLDLACESIWIRVNIMGDPLTSRSVDENLPCSGSYIWDATNPGPPTPSAKSNTAYEYFVRYRTANSPVTGQHFFYNVDPVAGIYEGHVISSGTFTTPNCLPTTGTIQGYKVLMPGNNQTAVPPANETVTLYNNVNTLYKASTDFSSTQGQRNWYYLESNGNQMVYDLVGDPTGYDMSNSWRGLEVFPPPRYNWNRLWSSKGHPERALDVVRRWVAPGVGTIHITGNASDGFPTGDGVIIFIKKNNAILWQGTIENGNTTGISYDINTPVSPNDNIDFVINKRGNNIGDVTNFDPSIDFVGSVVDRQTNVNPYMFSNVSAGSHVVSVGVPAGWSVGYTLCYNATTCHNNAPTPGNSVTVDVPAGGYSDLWWHYTAPLPPQPPDYSLSANPPSIFATIKGSSPVTSSSRIYVSTIWGGFSDNITFSASDVEISPTITGATFNFSDMNLVQSEYSAGTLFSITIPSNTTPSPPSYTNTIHGRSDDPVRNNSVDVTLNVALKDPGFRETLRPILEAFANFVSPFIQTSNASL